MKSPNHRRQLDELIRLAWPIAVSMVSFSTMSLVDTLFVGRISAAAIAGVGLASLLAFTLGCFTIGLLRAIKILAAQAVGAGRSEGAWRFFGAGLLWASALGVLAVVLGQGIRWAMPLLAADGATAREASAYFAVRLWSLPLLGWYVATREMSYGLGNSRAPMMASLIANVTNGLLDYLFIVGLDQGVAGAAWASLLAQGIELGLLWIALDPPIRALAPTGRHLREVWRLGVATGLQFVVEVGSFTLMGLIIAGISKIELAGHQIALHALHLSFLPAHAIGEAGAVLVGRSVGAGRFDEVPSIARVTLLTASVYTAAFTVLLLLTASGLGSWFTDDLRVAAVTGVLLFFAASFQIVDGAAIVAGALLRGVGDVRFVALSSVVVAWLSIPTGAFFLGRTAGMGALGAWIGIAVDIGVICALLWARLGGGRWLAAAERTRATALSG